MLCFLVKIFDSKPWLYISSFVTVISIISFAWLIIEVGFKGDKLRKFIFNKLAKNLVKANIIILSNDKNLLDIINKPKIFEKNNIKRVGFDDLTKEIKKNDLLIIDYSSFDEIFDNSKNQKLEDKTLRKDEDLEELLNSIENTFVIIYANGGSLSIPTETFKKICQKDNLSVTNAKGRLLSDIFTSLVTRPDFSK